MSNPDFSELESEFGEVIDILREGRLDPPDESPGPIVWNRIADDLDMETVPVPAAIAEAKAGGSHRGSSSVVSLDARRSRGRTMAIGLAAAAAVLLVAVPLALGLRGSGADSTAELMAVGGWSGTGQAELDGRQLTVDVDGPAPETGTFYELWLVDLEGEEISDVVSLGRVAADATHTVPDAVDLAAFSTVAISLEPDDGNPAHSGENILLGGLG